ncbi:DUF3658 domain-containing protein [Paenibacillus sp. SC116]|nr:DUF3658 domain-containing protein [Paenibacillus sp. SC116]MCR8842293.1 DUF3658 domain-containing protein [Paenibacillus sp. SC116]
MGDSEHCISDTYLAIRIRQMIDQGELSYRGNLELLSGFEIRLN